MHDDIDIDIETDTEDALDQVGFDMELRRLMLCHAVNNGPEKPLFYPSAVLRKLAMHALWEWESGNLSDEEFRESMHDILATNLGGDQ